MQCVEHAAMYGRSSINTRTNRKRKSGEIIAINKETTTTTRNEKSSEFISYMLYSFAHNNVGKTASDETQNDSIPS